MKILRLCVKILILPIKFLRAFGRAFVCMTIHRNLQMIHLSYSDHGIICKTCQAKEANDIKNTFLTFWYFGPGWCTFPFIMTMTSTAAIHQWLTGRPGHFEHPPEHSD